MPSSEIDYQALVRSALRDVVRRVLEPVVVEGLPGDHHFYLTFRTDDPGVSISPQLASAHPEEMTIVLQHDFHDLIVDEVGFSVRLRFGGRPEHLTVPFTALTAFVDPAAEFGLEWRDVEAEDEPAVATEDTAAESTDEDDSGTVLPFDPPGSS